MMSEAFIREHDVARRYLQGELTPEEEAEFEAYFLDKPELLEDLELDLMLHIGLQPAKEGGEVVQARRRPWFFRPLLSPLAAAAIVAVLGVPTAIVVYTQLLELREQVSVDRSPSADIRLILVDNARSSDPSRAKVSSDDARLGVLILFQLGYPESDSYDVVMVGPDGRAVFSDEAVRLTPNDEILIHFPPGLLQQGRYQLTADGADGDREAFAFEVE